MALMPGCYRRLAVQRKRGHFSDERGITLQTLIVTAVLVAVAVGAGVIYVAVARGGSERLEDSGRSGSDAKCEPWEIRSTALEARGAGGPFGHKGVFSSNIGCFAPCYWEIGGELKITDFVATPRMVAGFADSYLRYDTSNRNPDNGEIRLGVNYTRYSSDWGTLMMRGSGGMIDFYGSDATIALIKSPGLRVVMPAAVYTQLDSAGSDPPVIVTFFARSTTDNEVGTWADQGIGRWTSRDEESVYKPNWFSGVPDDSAFSSSYDDAGWEVRAKPGLEACEIVDTQREDAIVCSSRQANCLESGYHEEFN